MNRLCFGRQPADTRYRYHPGLPFSEGMPRSNDASFSSMSWNFHLTSNKGNMFIGEGASRIFKCDKNHSAMLSVHVLYNHYKASGGAMDLINNNFDALVLPMANEIRPNMNHDGLVKALERITIPIVVLGMGMQNDLGPDLSELDPSTVAMLKLVNERALVFGVRGFYTEKWLKSVGFDNAVALGCPSMMLYPDNILSIKAPTPGAAGKRFVTAGYLSAKSRRGLQLAKFFAGQDVSYVFQDELQGFSTELGSQPFLNDATGRLKQDVIAPLVREAIGYEAPFKRYFHFDDVEAWRQSYSWHDICIADRFHGAVAAMQSGLPTAILYKDLRVKEMCEFFGVPHTTVDIAYELEIDAFIDKYLSPESIAKFQQTYLQRATNFQRVLKSKGLELNKDIETAVPVRQLAVHA